jgi:signal transduction histidine kinase
VSHELNSPIAVVRSGLETMVRILQKHERGELDADRMVTLLDEMRVPAERSTERLEEIVERMQRFTHLDQAEDGHADLNRLLEDAVSTLEPAACQKGPGYDATRKASSASLPSGAHERTLLESSSQLRRGRR